VITGIFLENLNIHSSVISLDGTEIGYKENGGIMYNITYNTEGHNTEHHNLNGLTVYAK